MYIGAMPELEPINDDLTKIVAEFRRLAPTRHDVVHGAIASVTAKGAAFPFVKLDHDDRHIPTAREFELDAASLDPFIADLNKLTALAIRTVNWLLGPMRTRYGAIPPVNQT